MPERIQRLRQVHVQAHAPLGLSVAPSAISMGTLPLSHPLPAPQTVLHQHQQPQQVIALLLKDIEM